MFSYFLEQFETGAVLFAWVLRGRAALTGRRLSRGLESGTPLKFGKSWFGTAWLCPAVREVEGSLIPRGQHER